MLYPFMTIGFLIVFIVYVLYLALTKKLKQNISTVVYPGMFFISVWAGLYFLVFR
jgi:hypothetical protein